MRVAPERIDAQIVRGRALRIMQIRSDGSLTKIEAPGAGATLTTLPWPSVNPAAPERMVRGSGRRASSVDYLVLNVFDNKPSWYLYLKSGAYYSGDAAGRHVRRIG
jgi:hypothetical protein